MEPIPERIRAYRVLRRLIAPGPAETFLGRVEGPRGFARECVLKRMKSTIDGNERLAEELTREAAICARINHPAILRMVDFFEDAGHLVLALEHLEGPRSISSSCTSPSAGRSSATPPRSTSATASPAPSPTRTPPRTSRARPRRSSTATSTPAT